MQTAKSEQARISAAKKVLDRAYGKATQLVENAQETSHAEQLREIERRLGLFDEEIANTPQ